jgi:hypothetical protein
MQGINLVVNNALLTLVTLGTKHGNNMHGINLLANNNAQLTLIVGDGKEQLFQV